MKYCWKNLLVVLIVLMCSMVVATTAGFAKEGKEVLIGALFPLSGSSAQSGQDCKDGVELAVEIINNSYPEINLPFAKSEGLDNLNGAKLKYIFTDHQGDPSSGRAETERLITQRKVVAVQGVWHSSVAATVSMAAERLKTPFLCCSSASPSLTEKGFKYIFRTWPHDGFHIRALFDYMYELGKKRNFKFQTLAMMYDDTLWGQDSAMLARKNAARLGLDIVLDMSSRSNSTSLDTEVQKLKSANADVFFAANYTSDAILLVKTMKKLNYKPKLHIGNNGGWSQPDIIATLGNDSNGFHTRSSANWDLVGLKPALAEIMRIYKEKIKKGPIVGGGIPMGAMATFTGTMALADAINRAGSTDSGALKKALEETNIPAKDLIMPSWQGIKYDPITHQNILGRSIVLQIQDKKFVTVYPFEIAQAQPVFPLEQWK